MTTPTAAEIRRRIFVALDVPTLPAAQQLVQQLQGQVGGFKVGLELCTAAGVPAVIETLAAAGANLFLDLKLKDIPNTVAATVRVLAQHYGQQIAWLTLHADGGSAMLHAAATARADVAATQPTHLRLLAVTILTSISPAVLAAELGVPDPLEQHVVRLAHLAQQAGVAGVVASPHEIAPLRAACSSDLTIITPGVRPTGSATADQQRTMTPAAALHAGANYLVLGRPITAAPDAGGAAAALERIVAACEQELQELNGTSSGRV